MMQIDNSLRPADLKKLLERLFSLSAAKIRDLDSQWDPGRGTPVFTVRGKYTTRGWTEWTQGFQFGSAILQFEAEGDPWFLEYGRRRTVELMATHVSHIGVHDHGFNNVSTYGNLLRQAVERKIEASEGEKDFYRMALKCSGAVQAARWSRIRDGRGYIYSFNGPHSLFSDTIRSLRSLALAHRLGHSLMGEMDRPVSLLERLVQHAQVTAEFNVYYGRGRDSYDRRGRVAHESIFNVNDGNYRCPSSQQGYSPFTTWTRGLAWILCGYAELLEFFSTLSDSEFSGIGDRTAIQNQMREAAEATADFYIENTTADGIPFWDTGAPHLVNLERPLDGPGDPYNDEEPLDSSAAAIAAQGLWRLGNPSLQPTGEGETGRRYRQAALTVARTLFQPPYLSQDSSHQGLILHSIYHRPNGWDHVPEGRRIPCGESSMWGDYHARELALILLRELRGESPLYFHSAAGAAS